jgi:MFS family permease
MVVAGSWPLLAVLFVVQPLSGVGQGVLNGAFATLVMTRVHDSVRGQVGASLNGLARGFSIIALLLGGVLVHIVGPAQGFVICGISGLIVICVLARRVVSLAGSSPSPGRSRSAVGVERRGHLHDNGELAICRQTSAHVSARTLTTSTIPLYSLRTTGASFVLVLGGSTPTTRALNKWRSNP